MSVAKNFARNISTIRESLNLNQTQMAKKLGVCQQTISMYEKCDRSPHLTELDDIAAKLDISPEELLGFKPLSK